MSVDANRYEERAKHQSYEHRLAVIADEAGNVVADGPLDDTISSRMQRWKIGNVPHPNRFKKLFGKFMCWWLGGIEPEHDVKANAGDLGKAEAEEARTRSTLEKSGAEDIR